MVTSDRLGEVVKYLRFKGLQILKKRLQNYSECLLQTLAVPCVEILAI